MHYFPGLDVFQDLFESASLLASCLTCPANPPLLTDPPSPIIIFQVCMSCIMHEVIASSLHFVQGMHALLFLVECTDSSSATIVECTDSYSAIYCRVH